MLLLTGVILFTQSRLTPGRKNERTMTAKDALLISVAQGIAIIPGISRSGSTITAALWLGLDQQTAVKFSFLVSIPVIFGATLFELKDVLAFGFTGINSSLVIGTLASLFTGIFAIRIFVNLLQKGKFHFFAYYCWFAGAVTILYKIFFS
jgi:undecaprenyl-diphosphatase